jgi:hypothetical protein
MSKEDLINLVVIQSGVTRIIGLWDGKEGADGRLELTGVTTMAVRQVLDPATGMPMNAPTLATMDYNLKFIPRIKVRNWNWMYKISDLDEDTQRGFIEAYEGFRSMLENPPEKLEQSMVQAVPSGAIGALAALAQSGRLPPGIIPKGIISPGKGR